MHHSILLMRTGVGLLAFSAHTALPVAPLPLAQPSPWDLEDPRAPLSGPPPGAQLPGSFRGCEYLLATEAQLWLKAYRWAPLCGCGGVGVFRV